MAEQISFGLTNIRETQLFRSTTGRFPRLEAISIGASVRYYTKDGIAARIWPLVPLGVTYSIYLVGGPIATTPTRSLPSLDHHFQVHPNWEPTQNCTTNCPLGGGTPQHTWTPIGNGTHGGIYHELHFMHNDHFTVHRAYQGVDSTGSPLTPRQYRFKTNQLDSRLNPIYVDTYTRKDASGDSEHSYKRAFDAYSSPVGFAEVIGEAVEESVAESKVGSFCLDFLFGGLPSASDPAQFLQITRTGSGDDPPAATEENLDQCQPRGISEINSGSVLFSCGTNLFSIDHSLTDDPDGNLSPNIWSRSSSKRDGTSILYRVRNGLDRDGVSVVFESAP